MNIILFCGMIKADKEDYIMQKERSDELLNQGAKAYQSETPEGFRTAVRYYLESASLGNGQAMTNLGYCYTYGRGVTNNPAEGFRYFVQAAKLGNPEAIMKVADAYQCGQFVKKDEIRAFQFYRKLFQHLREMGELMDYPEVCLRLGRCYLEGKGTEADLRQARRFLVLAVHGYSLHEDQYFYYPKQRRQAEELLRQCQ